MRKTSNPKIKNLQRNYSALTNAYLNRMKTWYADGFRSYRGSWKNYNFELSQALEDEREGWKIIPKFPKSLLSRIYERGNHYYTVTSER